MARFHPIPGGRSARSRGAAERPGGGQRKPPPDREGGETAAAGVFRHRSPGALLSPGGRRRPSYPGQRRGAPGDPPAAQPRAASPRRRPPGRPGRLAARARLRRRRQDHRPAPPRRGRPLPGPLPGLQQGRPAPGPVPLARPRPRSPAPVPCRTVHSLAYRATRMFEQQHRLERRLAAREVAGLLAIPALDGLRPSFWAYCAITAVRTFTHSTAREIDADHLPPLPRGPDRAEPVLAWARELWAGMRDPAGALPLEHDAYLKLWHLQGARLPAGAEVLYLDEAQDANPVTLAVLAAQGRPTVWVGDPWQSVYRFRGSVDALRAIDASP